MKNSLKRSLGLYPTTAIVIGSVIGSGIFVSSAGMARQLGSAPWLLSVWLVAGVMTLFGAFTQCELTGQMPRTGGLFEYFREIYGDGFGFLYGWANFMIAGSGAIAAIAFIFASYAGEFFSLPRLSEAWEKWPLVIPYAGTLYPFADMGTKALGATLILTLTAINARGVSLGAGLQSISTTAKVLALFIVVAGAFVLGSGSGTTANFFSASTLAPASSIQDWKSIALAVTLALSGAFWSYDGWGAVAYIAGEVKEPTRTIPRAILLGTAIFMSLYLLVNLAYLYILPIDQLGAVASDRVASAVVSSFAGPLGASLIAGLIVLSTFDTVNGTILTNGLVYYAMAQRGLFWKRAGAVHPDHGAPSWALWCQGLWAATLLLSGSFDLVTSMYVFVNWALYAMMGISVFVLRRRNPGAARPFRIPGYPWVPAIYVLFAVTYVVFTWFANRQASIIGVLLVLTGL
ncbi:MAG: amino acid permease, partial [Bdellovibrionota bacterium]